MTDESQQAELERLRAEVASYRQREREALEAALATARIEADHWKAEAKRLAQVGYEIDRTHRETITSLQSSLDAARTLHVNSRRPVLNGNA